jgi:hypothetical protein
LPAIKLSLQFNPGFVRLYFQAKDLKVYEITWNTQKGWHKGNSGTPLFTARRDSPLSAVVSKHHTHRSIFYIDTDGAIRECRFSDRKGYWEDAGTLPASQVADGSSLAAIDPDFGQQDEGVPGVRIYYQQQDNSIQELYHDGAWHTGKSFDGAVKGTALTAINANQQDARAHRLHLFYYKTNGYINHWSTDSGDWKAEQLLWTPKANTALTCVAWDNSGSEYEVRVYYSDASSSGKVQELGWVSTTGKWTESPKINYTLTPGDKPVVTDLGPYGRIISVYENYGDNTIGEMCFQERKWTPLFTIKWDSLKNA